MIQTYAKGSRAERELIRMFEEAGYSVIRAAGSGFFSRCPDLLVFKRGKQYGFESKFWNKNTLSLKKSQVEGLFRWEENTGITTMIAWKINRIGWRFIPIHLLKENPKSYTISKSTAINLYSFEDLV